MTYHEPRHENSRWSLCFSPLFFANDSVLFWRATTEEYHIILDILGLYEAASSEVDVEEFSYDQKKLFDSSLGPLIYNH
jgi:hypothetical protein